MPQACRELWVLRRSGDDWTIAQYTFQEVHAQEGRRDCTKSQDTCRSPSSVRQRAALPSVWTGARSALIACRATAVLSPSVASRLCPRLQSQVSGENVRADRSRQGERHVSLARVIVNIAPEIAVKPFDWPYP
jgi:hypothetical protein